MNWLSIHVTVFEIFLDSICIENCESILKGVLSYFVTSHANSNFGSRRRKELLAAADGRREGREQRGERGGVWRNAELRRILKSYKFYLIRLQITLFFN